MPAITVRRVPLASTRGYEAPSGLPRVRMRPNGVQMLAAVNGRGAYDAYMSNGPKRKRRKASRKAAKARRYTTRSRAKGISPKKRAKFRRKAAKATRRSGKLKKKAKYQSYVKKLANKAGLTRKQLMALLMQQGATKSEAQACATGHGVRGGVCETVPMSALKEVADQIQLGQRQFEFNGSRPEIFFSNREEEDMQSNGRGRKRRKARKSGRRASARRSSRRSHSRGRRRSSARRSARSRKGRSRGRRSGRRGYRRNGSDGDDDDFAANPYHDFEANGYDFEANKKRGKKRKSRVGGGDKKFAKLFRQAMGVPRGASGEAYMGQVVLDRFADQARSGAITLEQYKQLRKQIAKSAFPKQTGKGAVIPVRIQDPITGKSKVVKVKWSGKVHNAFGPYERKRKGGALTYLIKGGDKGEKIPSWALEGGLSEGDFAVMSGDPDFRARALAAGSRISAIRARVAKEERDELEAKLQKLQDKIARGEVSDPMTPNKRGSRRRGRRRLSAKQRAAALRNLRKARSSKKRRSYGRKSRKGGRRRAKRKSRRSRKFRAKARRRSGRKARRSRKGGYSRKARRSSKRRTSRRGRKYGRRRSGRKGRKFGRRKGRKGYRRNATLPSTWVLATIGATAFALLNSRLNGQVSGALSFLGEYASAASTILMAGIGAGVAIFLGHKIGGETVSIEPGEVLGVSMVAAGAGGILYGLAQKAGIAGIPYVNTSGWGSRRPVGAYELRGTGAYELRGLGAYPQQALASYELRGLGGAQYAQALAGAQYAQALAAYPQQALAQYELRGLGQQPAYDEVLPSHADSALDWADQSTEGEYVNSQLQPAAPLFFQDSLANLGVPSASGGGIPSTSIWNPTGDSEVDPSAGIFADPNV